MSHPVPEVDHGEAPDVRPGDDLDRLELADIRPEPEVPGVIAARERLGELDEAPLEQHVDVYEDVHQRLQEGLADLDER